MSEDYTKLPVSSLLREEGFLCPYCGRRHKTGLRILRCRPGALNDIPEVLEELGAKHPFVICDDHTWEAAARRVTEILDKAGVEYGLHVFHEENLDPGTYNLLGTRQSHGCVRVPVRYAYWIYSFTERNQGIGVGENLVRPLNTLKLPRAVTAVDPTDPKYTGNWGYLDNQNYQFWHGQYLN